MGKKILTFLFILPLLVGCCTKKIFIIYGGTTRPIQVRCGSEWMKKDSIEQFVYRDTTQILKINHDFAIYINPKGFSEYEGHPVFTSHFQIENDCFFVHVRELGFGDSLLYIDVYKKTCVFWILQTCCTASFDYPISLKIDKIHRVVVFESPHDTIKDLPFENLKDER